MGRLHKWSKQCLVSNRNRRFFLKHGTNAGSGHQDWRNLVKKVNAKNIGLGSLVVIMGLA
jgi:hypothetical protein